MEGIRKTGMIMIVILLLLLSFYNSISGFSNSEESFDGWSIKTMGQIYSSPVVADLDNDGAKEIIVGSGGPIDSKAGLYVINNDGTIRGGWPIILESDVDGSPAIGNLDSDDDLEIVIGDVDNVYVFDPDGSLLPGWPKPVDFLTSSPTLYDIDSDGELEIIIGHNSHIDYDSFATFQCWEANGDNVDGWPQMITEFGTSYVSYSSVAVGDIDHDGDPEIVGGIDTFNSDDVFHHLFAWHHDGSLVDGWPAYNGDGNVYCSPALADLDGDLDLEIIYSSTNDRMWALHHDGSNVSGWPIKRAGSSRAPVVADIDQNGDFEIIYGITSGTYYVWDVDGSLWDGWPKYLGSYGFLSPIVCDVTGDERLEIIVCAGKKLHILYHNGSEVSGFPIQLDQGFSSSPCVDDIDGDGDIEVIAGSLDHYLYVWNLPFSLKEEGMEWPMFQHDLYHTGCHGFGKGFMVDANGPYYGRLQSEIDFTGSVINGKPPFSWLWDFGDGNTSTDLSPSHGYAQVGEYLVNCTVVDAEGKTVTDVDMVEVSRFGRIEYAALNLTSVSLGFGISFFLENRGVVDAEGVEWSIMVDESLELHNNTIIYPVNGTKSGMIDLAAGECERIWCFVYKKPGMPTEINIDISFSARIENCVVSFSSMEMLQWFIVK